MFALAGYLFGTMVTLGHLFRTGRLGARRRLLQVGASILWPLYWICVYGVIGTTKIMADAVSTLVLIILSLVESVINGLVRVANVAIEPLAALWAIGLIAFPAFYLGTQWGICSMPLCWDTIAKAIIWAPFWPVYLLTVI
jgi:hypothetical protein